MLLAWAISVDTIGLLLTVLVTAASVQDCDAAKPPLSNLRKGIPEDQARVGRRRLCWQARRLC